MSYDPSSYNHTNGHPPRSAPLQFMHAFLARWSLTIVLLLFVANVILSIFMLVSGSLSLLIAGIPLLVAMVLFVALGTWAKRSAERETDTPSRQQPLVPARIGNIAQPDSSSQALPVQQPQPRFRRIDSTVFSPHTVRQLAWSSTGDKLAICLRQGGVVIWNRLEQLQYTLTPKDFDIVTWSSDEALLALGSNRGDVEVWEIQSRQIVYSIGPSYRDVGDLVWSPDGQMLAILIEMTGSYFEIWDRRKKEVHRGIGEVNMSCMAWSPDGLVLASAAIMRSDRCSISFWDIRTKRRIRTFAVESNQGLLSIIERLAWSPDGLTLAAADYLGVISLWDYSTGKLIRKLEGFVGRISRRISQMTFSPNGKLFAIIDYSGIIHFWDTDNWSLLYSAGLSAASSLAGLGITFLLAYPAGPKIDILEIEMNAILSLSVSKHPVSYTNAKVVLIGDSGVGKSGLGLVLSGQPFTPTESTHGRRVWTFASQEVELEHNHKEMRETLLWDLAGQPGYRLIHQLYLNEVTVALVVFDAHSETDPLTGVDYWNRALMQAQSAQGSEALLLKKFLVAARVDRGSIGVSKERIREVVKSLGFDGYFETSAAQGWQIPELQEAIRTVIRWDELPKVSSTELFQQIKGFLVDQKKEGYLLATEDDLYALFLKSHDVSERRVENLRAQFETCIGRVESAGLIKRLSFGNRVLLQPELLDSYASALVNAVKDEPDGLGSIVEERVRAGQFRMPQNERIADRDQEKLLLIAMIEDLVRSDLVIREDQFLVFPSQATRENPDLPDPEGKAIAFEFEGPVLNIYATLAVRLANSGLFKMKGLWKNAITYTPTVGGSCGLYLRNIGEGRGELTLFYNKETGLETRRYFEEFTYAHLLRHALPDRLELRRFVSCSVCGFLVTDQLIRIRAERGFDWLDCPGCGSRIALQVEAPVLSPQVVHIDRAADRQRELEVAKTTITGKEATRDFDIFLCHHSIDKPAVKRIGDQLKQYGLLPWLDESELPLGRPWIRLLEEQIEHVKAAAVFVGKDGFGPWQRQELDALLREFVDRQCPVIPVLLEDAPSEPKLPVFLRGNTWVDFRQTDPDPLKRLRWGITGKRIE